MFIIKITQLVLHLQKYLNIYSMFNSLFGTENQLSYSILQDFSLTNLYTFLKWIIAPASTSLNKQQKTSVMHVLSRH